MNPSTFETTDLFRAAFILCVGGELKNVRFKTNGKQTASFIFTGLNLQKHVEKYRSGQARVEPLSLKESLNHLRDILFEELRKDNRRYDYERKRNNKIRRLQY